MDGSRRLFMRVAVGPKTDAEVWLIGGTVGREAVEQLIAHLKLAQDVLTCRCTSCEPPPPAVPGPGPGES